MTNPATGKQVEVEVNDRGPFVEGRDIDLSKGAAKELGMTKPAPPRSRSRPPRSRWSRRSAHLPRRPKVEKQLHEARGAAAADGTPQPKLVPLDAPGNP